MAKGKSDADSPKCGLCGKKKKLTRTECCGNWICDDEDEYVPFSYERNSCYRNHNHYTLCGYHHNEHHPGDWKDCPECRKAFETEMYVYYGTNEYNFEKLENPPAYEPTRCAVCGKIIKLGDDGFTQSGDDYWCESCAGKKLPDILAERDGPLIEVPAKRAKIGRNDPCPCGSGKKYKRCCLGKQTGTAGVFQDLKQAMQGKEFGSLKEVQAFADWHTGQWNRAPLDDFAGVSPEQMFRLLHFPFSSPHLVAFPPRLSAFPDAPMARLFDVLTKAIGEDGLKATATGNLPPNFVRESALTYFSDEEVQPGLRSEIDFFDLHVVRIVSGLASLIRKNRGRFILTARCRELLSQEGALYPALFRAFVEKYNWAFRDGYPDFRIIQQSFLFSLWLFRRFGDEWRSPAFYEDRFLIAFPTVLSEAESERDYTTPEETVRSCYAWRCLEGFAVFTGILEVNWEKRGILNRSFTLRKTALLDEIVSFHL